MGLRTDNGPFNVFAEAETIIEFYNLDPMQIVWHGDYIDFFEIGRRSLLDKIDCGYNEIKDLGYEFPVVKISVKYLRPLKYKDRICIKAILMEYENCLRIKYEIRNAETGVIVTRGLSTQMACNFKTGESCFNCPDVLIKKVDSLINKQKSGIPDA